MVNLAVRKIPLLLALVNCGGQASEPLATAPTASAVVPAPVAAPPPAAPAPAAPPPAAPPPAAPPPAAPVATRLPKGYPAKLVGVVELNYDISDRGVAYFGTAESNLTMELQSAADGAFTLKVTGKGVQKGGFLNPTAKTQQARPHQPFSFNHTWVGHWAVLDGSAVIHIDGQMQMGWKQGVGNTSIELRPAARDFRCSKVAAEAAAPAHFRCDLAVPDTGFPWEGKFPDYLRAPLIFGLNGSVRSSLLVYDQRVVLRVSAIPSR
ncbi:MAG TPA: hypothetical protein PLF40_01640 [Kofleriaceae bacterium]|nr:hypothetical protein [Kofleriaceae bacterium]